MRNILRNKSHLPNKIIKTQPVSNGNNLRNASCFTTFDYRAAAQIIKKYLKNKQISLNNTRCMNYIEKTLEIL